jgi:hypothetical protein
MGPKPSVIVYVYALRADVREPEIMRRDEPDMHSHFVTEHTEERLAVPARTAFGWSAMPGEADRDIIDPRTQWDMMQAGLQGSAARASCPGMRENHILVYVQKGSRSWRVMR